VESFATRPFFSSFCAMASLWGEGYKKVMENPYYAGPWIFQASN